MCVSVLGQGEGKQGARGGAWELFPKAGNEACVIGHREAWGPPVEKEHGWGEVFWFSPEAAAPAGAGGCAWKPPSPMAPQSQQALGPPQPGCGRVLGASEDQCLPNRSQERVLVGVSPQPAAGSGKGRAHGWEPLLSRGEWWLGKDLATAAALGGLSSGMRANSL